MGPPTRTRLLQRAAVSVRCFGGFPPTEAHIGAVTQIRPTGRPRALPLIPRPPGRPLQGEYTCISLEDLAVASSAPEGTIMCPRAHRVKEVNLGKGDPAFPAREAFERATRHIGPKTDPVVLPVPVDL